MIQGLKRLIVKFGTQNLMNGSGSLDQSIFDDYALQIYQLVNHGIEVVLVCSGAIQAGREAAHSVHLEPKRLHKKELAALGSARIMSHWQEAFDKTPCSIVTAQIPVTYANWENEQERQSIKSSIIAFGACGIVPIVNENDVVSQREIVLMEQGISENDRLARMIAILIKANAALFLTEFNGIYRGDPRVRPSAPHYAEIRAVATPDELGITKGLSPRGNGGMAPKLVETSICATKRGMRVAIAGNQEDVILKFARGEQVGTLIGQKTILDHLIV
jgi:glutamate 5-kinase